jgi:nitrate/nitrite transporter NarK
MEKYPLVSRNNVPAYLKVMSTWCVLSVGMAALLKRISGGSLSRRVSMAFSMCAVMLGMMIMFVASALNLRKLRPGFERLANGEREPGIPKVWCPVLTMATRSAVGLCDRVAEETSTE